MPSISYLVELLRIIIMKIILKNNTIGYSDFIKLFTVAWTVGLGTFLLGLIVFAFVAYVLAGDWSKAAEAATGIIVVPIILVMQSLIIGSIGYFGIIIYSKIKSIEFINDR